MFFTKVAFMFDKWLEEAAERIHNCLSKSRQTNFFKEKRKGKLTLRYKRTSNIVQYKHSSQTFLSIVVLLNKYSVCAVRSTCLSSGDTSTTETAV